MTMDIVDIFRDVVSKASQNLKILCPDGNGGFQEVDNPPLNDIFGNSQYIKDTLDVYSQSERQLPLKFPLVALFCPISEKRDSRHYYSKSKVSLVIACPSTKDWTNEEREVNSFKNILRPIYGRLLDVLLEDNRFDWGADDKVRHVYSENYSYGRYGAMTATGQEVSDPIDAIDISSMEITINNPNCRR